MPKLGQHMSGEQKAKISASEKGKLISPETRAKLSAINMGKHLSDGTRARLSLAHNYSLESRAKISAAAMGRIMSPETRAKVSAGLMGRTTSPETRAKNGAVHWKGGLLVSVRKHHAKRRLLGFNPLNSPFVGCEGHHINKDDVIYMPEALHKSIYHRQRDGRGMEEMNALAIQFLTESRIQETA